MRFLINLILLIFIYFLLLNNIYAQNGLPRMRVAHLLDLDIKLNGIDEKLRKNVQLELDHVKNAYDSDWSKENIQRFYEHAPQKIKKALEPYGYFKSSIQSKLTHFNNKWIASFDISLGKPLSIKEMDLKLLGEGSNNSALQQLFHHFPIIQGDIFETEKYENAKLELFKIANNEGYIKCFFEKKEIRIDLSKNEVTIILYFQTGPRYYFGQAIFEKSQYDKNFLSRFITLKDREPFSSQKILNLQESLSNSYYFQQADVTPDFDHIENYDVPLRFSLLAPKSQRYNFGIGYGTYTGPRITARTEFKRITNTGQHFDAQLRLSPVLSGIGAKYYIPGKNPLTDQWTLGTNYQNFNPQNGRSISQTISADYETQLKNIEVSAGVNYLIERFKINDTPKKTSELFYPKINLSYVNADDLINPNKGLSYNIFLQGASQLIFSSTSFIQGDIKGKYLMSPTSLSKLILRGEFGYTVVHDLNELPLSMRFFAGGLNSIRGYGDSEIGPGRYLEVGSIEFRHQVIKNFSASLFYDLGTASDKFRGPYFGGTGVGAIFQSILGPVKLYATYGLDKPRKPFGFEFTIGPEF